MDFEQLCKDFDIRRPKGKMIGRSPFFKAIWDDGRKSVNDLLRSFLRDHKYEYINVMGGTVWFLIRGKWRCCQYDVNGDIVQFYLCDFADR